MDDNPYTAPQATAEALPRERIRFGLGNLVFLGLGGVFVLFPALAIMQAISGAQTVPIGLVIGAAVVIVLGLLVMAHGVLRSNVTIAIVSYVLLAMVALVVTGVVVRLLV